MKTYRCPWCVSRTNHNILYFVHISRTSSLNTAICLWKLRISLAPRGFPRSILPQIQGMIGASPRPPRPCLNPSPARTPAQGAEPVHFARTSVQVVDIWTGLGRSCLTIQSAASPGASAGEGPAQLRPHLARERRTQRVFQLQTAANPDGWSRMTCQWEGSEPRAQTHLPASRDTYPSDAIPICLSNIRQSNRYPPRH